MAIEWAEDRWGTHIARAGLLLTLSVYWQSGGRDGESGYRYNIGSGIKGNKVYPSSEEAKDAAVVSARRHLRESIEALAE